MGYRSDIKAAFYAPKDKAAALKLYVDENFPKDFDLDLHPIHNGHYQGYMCESDDVKWYESYPEVVAFNRFVANFLEIADGENGGELRWAYEFVRVGEDNDDIEEIRSDYSDYQLSVERNIGSEFNRS